jgi:hypothetical protein
MEALINTQKEVVWFHKITEPALELLSKRVIIAEKDTGEKLFFSRFVTLLLYFYLQGIDSLRSLITNLKTDDNVEKIGLCPIGLSTIHDAFCRYQVALFKGIYVRLLQTFPVIQLEEFKELGRFVISDGSVFPMAIGNLWAEFRKNSRALKLHLNFELNQMIPTCFIVTSGKGDERHYLSKMIEKAVTYITDRGYISFDFFKTIVDKGAFFIIRVRKNLHYQVNEELPVRLKDSVKFIFFQVTDELVRFDADKHQNSYRRISFRTRTTLFVFVTNRLDLTTYQIIRLYAFRWQIELFFRYFKRTLNAIHIIHNSQNGVTIQFYIMLITNLLLLKFKQDLLNGYLLQKKICDNLTIFYSTEDFVKSIGEQIPKPFKIKKQEMIAIRNLLLKSIQLAFDFY